MTTTMAKKKTTTGTGDRHKPRALVGIPGALIEVIDALVARHLTDRTAEVVRLVREGLEREGLWPPKPDQD